MKKHCWDVSVNEAFSIQKALKNEVIDQDTCKDIKHTGGVDIAYCLSQDTACCFITVFSYPCNKLVSCSYSVGKISFPYVPGLFAFREGPLIEKAFEYLEIIPDLLIFDGHGLCHPRGMGIATHMGILLDVPSIGCAKKHLFGTYDEPGPFRGNKSYIYSLGKVLGCALRTRDNVKPVFISQGHRISLSKSVEICLSCSRGYRIPEPVRMAHILARKHL
jgi:deoxyribonuclease V